MSDAIAVTSIVAAFLGASCALLLLVAWKSSPEPPKRRAAVESQVENVVGLATAATLCGLVATILSAIG